MSDDHRSKPQDLRDRTHDYALRIIRLYGALPKRAESRVIGKQMLRSGTAVGAIYREGLRARSKVEYAAKLNLSLMELEETLYWLGDRPWCSVGVAQGGNGRAQCHTCHTD